MDLPALIQDRHVADLVWKLERLPLGTCVSLDTETTGLHPYNGDVIRGVSIGWQTADENLHSHYLPVSHPLDPDSPTKNLYDSNVVKVFEALQKCEPFLVLHHGKFDFHFLRQLPRATHGGPLFPIPVAGEWWDTKIVAWLIDENMPTGLKEQAAFHWGEDQRDEQKAVKALVRKKGWGGLTADDVAVYAAKDAELTLRLFNLQFDVLKGLGLDTLGDVRPALMRELEVTSLLCRMERTGILVDAGRIEELYQETEAACHLLEEQFLASYETNLSSPKQVAALVYDRWNLPGPASRSVNRAALEQLADNHDQVAAILRHRRLKKALTSYLVPLGRHAASSYDGRIHPSFSSTGTVTGRFSCSDPNLQTIPRGDTLIGVRDVFVAEDGFELWEYDLASAELRVMAGMANEPRLIEAVEHGVDMHSENAKAIFGEGFTPLQRRSSKNIFYGWCYGLTNVGTAVKYITGMAPDEAAKTARRVLDGMKTLYPRLARLMMQRTNEAKRKGYVPIGDAWPGRYRRFQTQSVRRPAPFTALNAQVQGGIGELMKDVMLVAEPMLDAFGARLCLQVHDSLVVEVPDGYGPKMLELLNEVVADLNPFAMAMVFDGKPWADHD